MRKLFGVLIIFFIFAKQCIAHERWLLTPQQLITLTEKPVPSTFNKIGFFNTSFLILACIIALVWVYLFYREQENYSLEKTFNRITRWSSFFLRLGVGTMLLISAFGIIPQEGVARWTTPTLFTPDLSLPTAAIYGQALKWLEVILGIGLLIGFYTSFISVLLIVLAMGCLYWFGEPMVQYFLLYFPIFIYLITQGPGPLALKKERNYWRLATSTWFLQICTGLSFIYTAINYKLLQPNFDIAILAMHKAFTFGLSYDKFVYLMALTEFFSGVLIILGYGLRYLAIVLFILFVFLAINVHENLFVHNFIYGILVTFLLNGGVPITRFYKAIKRL